jgi:hypothetical protein
MDLRMSAGAFCLRIGWFRLSGALMLLVGAPFFFMAMNDAPFMEALIEFAGTGATLWAIAAACFAVWYCIGLSERT